MKLKETKIFKAISIAVVFSFLLNMPFPVASFAQNLELSPANQFIKLSPEYSFPVLKGLKFDPQNPLRMEFIVDTADKKDITKEEASNLIRYFLAGLTIAEEDIWVNLSPYEKDKIITAELGQTDLGKDLLSQDYLLKQLTASLTYPENDTGRDYWDKTYREVFKIAKTTNLPVNTFNKIWIVPDQAEVYENANQALITKATLKTMLEEDYLALKSNTAEIKKEKKAMNDGLIADINQASSRVMNDVVLPKINSDVNQGENFAQLRQIYHSLILGIWFKKKFQDSLYAHYINKGKIAGIDLADKQVKDKIYNHYVEAFKSGLYNYIKTDSEPQTSKKIKRRYYSGGFSAGNSLRWLKTTLSISPSDIYRRIKDFFVGSAASLIVDFAPTPTQPAGNVAKVTAASSSLQSAKTIRTELREPEGQPKGFFTNSYVSYNLSPLLKKLLEIIPDEVVDAVRKKLEQDKVQGKILSAVVKDYSGVEIDIHTTHRYGELNAAVHRLMLEAFREGILKAQELGLLREGASIDSMSLEDLTKKALRLKTNEHSITERGAEPVVIAKIIGAGIGAANIKAYHEFFMPGATPLQKLGFVPEVGEKGKPGVRGFRAIVRRTEDVLKGNFEGPVWEFEKSAAFKIGEKQYPSKDESLELLALASQPNDFIITAIYTVEGSTLPSTEPIVSVVYQPVYGEKGELRTLNPTFICRSQSGADAVAGVASMYYDVNFVPGGPNGEYYVATRPVTLEEARKAPKEGTANVVVYGWQSKGNGVIPPEKDGVIDHVAINPEALSYDRKLANWLASIMTTHQYDQPYLTPLAAQAQVETIRNKQGRLFTRAPKEADIDPFMEELEARVATGKLLSVTDDKADMGGKFGHNFAPEYMLAINRATVMEAIYKGILSDGNIIGFTDKGRLGGGTTVAIGDDGHILMLGDTSRNSAEAHQLAFLAFTRGYLAAVVNGEKPYGLAQDYQGKEAKAAKANPYFYSHLTSRFFEILKTVMPEDYMGMVDKMEEGWKKWQETSETVKLPEPFSGNVSQQGIGSARYLVDIKGGERTFGILAGDKMGPAALNRPIREGVYAALKGGKFLNGLVFEIWDAKAFDEHGNIPLDKLPQSFADLADSITQLKEQSEQEFVKGSYKDGLLKTDLSVSDKERLAQLLKKAGYVPTERIFLDAEKDKEAIYLYLADSDRFNIKQVWGKKTAGWDINRPQAYLDKPVLGSSVTKLGILAGGEYIGKDDPVMVGNIGLMDHIYTFLEKNPLIIQGDMNGSHWLAAIPTKFKYAVANKESHPILVGLVYTLSEDGKTLASVKDIFDNKDFGEIRQTMFEFNHKFKQAQLGGQFEPYGTNWRTVEASYPLAKLLRALQDPKSPFLVKNKPAEERKSRPTGLEGEVVELYKAATASSAISSADKQAVADWIAAAREAGATPAMVPESLRKAENQKREYVIAGNWKMAVNTETEARRIVSEIVRAIQQKGLIGEDIDIVIPMAPSFVHLQAVREQVQAVREQIKRYRAEGVIRLAAQDVSAYEPGARTGDVSAKQLKDLGVEYVIVGHSERRRHQFTPESSELVNLKAKMALKYGLRPIIAVGETLDEREAGRTYKVISEQVLESLKGLTAQEMENVVIAYEPVWAIGTGKTATPEQANEVHRFIRALLLNTYGYEAASQTQILYGGSVNAGNTAFLIAQPNIDGGLIGGASLKPEFTEIVEKALNNYRAPKAASSSITQGEKTSPWVNGDNPGGIDLEKLKNINTAPNSSPVNFGIPFDVNNFSGFSFQIVSLEKLEDLESVFVTSPEKKEAKELAYLR